MSSKTWTAIPNEDDGESSTDEHRDPPPKVIVVQSGGRISVSGLSPSQKPATKDPWKKIWVPVSFILLWYVTSLGLSMYNKWLFGERHHNFKFPLFTSAVHMCLQAFFSWAAMTFLWPRLKPKKYPPIKDYLLRVLPCGIATGLDIGLSNSSLKTISLSFYTMVKSGAPVFVVLFAFWFGLERPTWTISGIIMIICLGVLLMVIHETNFHLVGYLQVQIATILAGFRWSITQILLERESIGMSNPFATSFFLAPVMAVCLGVASLVLEGTPMSLVASIHFSTFSKTLETLGWISVGGIVAFVLVISEFKVISTTSVVTFSIAGIFKEIVTITASAVVFKDRFTPTNILGLVISLIGIALYNYVRIAGMKGSGHGGHHHHSKRVKTEIESTLDGQTVYDGSDVGTASTDTEQHRSLLRAAEEFFDVDIDGEDGLEEDSALYGARSAGVFGYNPVTSFITVPEPADAEGNELSTFYPQRDIEEEDEESGGLTKRESLL
ncbi:Triose-phosphate Transporter [Phlyctochytrium planicorne]|nr:Triose-phosphate Transporter [Phlyctochytrium planicorne]